MQNYKKIAVACALLFALASCWYWLAGRNDVYDIRYRANAVRNELADAEKSQRDEAAVIDRTAETANRIEKLEQSDAAVIRESESIISRIRERGTT